MRRPWHIWLAYLLCLAIVLPAMAWLTSQTFEADRAQWQATVSAEREETIGSVLWQMDTQLTSLLAQEAARPHFVYSSFYAAPAVVTSGDETTVPPPEPPSKPTKGAERPWSPRQLPSPLLSQTSPYVLLHFQINAAGELTSPQAPAGKLAKLALDNGAEASNIDHSNVLLEQLCSAVKYDKLLALLPAERLPEMGVAQWQVANTSIANLNNNDSPYVGNSLDYNPVRQQLDQAQSEPIGQQSGLNANAPPQFAQSENPNAGYNVRSSRAGNDLQQRNQAYQAAAQRQVIEQRLNYNSAPQLKYVSEGVSRPVWLDSRLLLARRVKVGDSELIQGCWLDWPKLRDELKQQYREDLPALELQPVTAATDPSLIKVNRMLATLPVQMALPEMAFPPQPWSPLRAALLVAWAMLAVAAGAVAILLQGVVTLSERRGAFVSAVTHELRTPLTTFRMYAEMLAENMVPDASTRQRYLETLRVEADRLAHLVENVLAYARLERGRHGSRREPTYLADRLVHWQQRFADRAQQAEMNLVVEPSSPECDEPVATDPSAVEQIVFNLIDNACKYAVTAKDRRIHLELSAAGRYAVIRVRDHGPGIDAKAARRLFQPFSKSVHDAACSAPGVGLGLALSRRLAQELGGRLELETNTGGATFALYLPR